MNSQIKVYNKKTQKSYFVGEKFEDKVPNYQNRFFMGKNLLVLEVTNNNLEDYFRNYYFEISEEDPNKIWKNIPGIYHTKDHAISFDGADEIFFDYHDYALLEEKNKDLDFSEFRFNSNSICWNNYRKYTISSYSLKKYNINIARTGISQIELNEIIKELKEKVKNIEDSLNPKYNRIKEILFKVLGSSFNGHFEFKTSFDNTKEEVFIAISECLNLED